MILNGKHVSEDVRLRLLREEESQLGIQPWEIVSNEILTARLVRVDSTPVRQMPGEAAEKSVAKKDADHPSRQVEDVEELRLVVTV